MCCHLFVVVSPICVVFYVVMIIYIKIQNIFSRGIVYFFLPSALVKSKPITFVLVKCYCTQCLFNIFSLVPMAVCSKPFIKKRVKWLQLNKFLWNLTCKRL